MMAQFKAQPFVRGHFDEGLSTSASEDENPSPSSTGIAYTATWGPCGQEEDENFGPSSLGNNYTATWGPWGPEDDDDISPPWNPQALLPTMPTVQALRKSPPSPPSPSRWADVDPAEPADPWDAKLPLPAVAQAESVEGGINNTSIMMVPYVWVMGTPPTPNQAVPMQAVPITPRQELLSDGSIHKKPASKHVKLGVEHVGRVQAASGLGKATHSCSRDNVNTSSLPDDQRTTVMMRNLPLDVSRDELLTVMDAEGFKGFYNFIYMPMDFQKDLSFGYAFVNFVSTAAAERVRLHFDSFTLTHKGIQTIMDATWSGPHQGLVAHVERFRNSPVMHEDVAEKYKPLMFSGGERIPFPAPTKRIRKPRLRHVHTDTLDMECQ